MRPQLTRTLRHQAIGRKNWLFLGSEQAGPRAAGLLAYPHSSGAPSRAASRNASQSHTNFGPQLVVAERLSSGPPDVPSDSRPALYSPARFAASRSTRAAPHELGPATQGRWATLVGPPDVPSSASRPAPISRLTCGLAKRSKAPHEPRPATRGGFGRLSWDPPDVPSTLAACALFPARSPPREALRAAPHELRARNSGSLGDSSSDPPNGSSAASRPAALFPAHLRPRKALKAPHEPGVARRLSWVLPDVPSALAACPYSRLKRTLAKH